MLPTHGFNVGPSYCQNIMLISSIWSGNLSASGPHRGLPTQPEEASEMCNELPDITELKQWVASVHVQSHHVNLVSNHDSSESGSAVQADQCVQPTGKPLNMGEEATAQIIADKGENLVFPSSEQELKEWQRNDEELKGIIGIL